jgi:hypothetical protein
MTGSIGLSGIEEDATGNDSNILDRARPELLDAATVAVPSGSAVLRMFFILVSFRMSDTSEIPPDLFTYRTDGTLSIVFCSERGVSS